MQDTGSTISIPKRMIYLRGRIGGDLADEVCKGIIEMNHEGVDPITVYIDSGGGEVISCLDIFDVVKNSKAPVVGIVVRRAGSGAAYILQACHTRKAYLNSDIFLHNSLIELSLDVLCDDRRRINALRKLIGQQRRFVQEVAKRIKKSPREVEKLLGKGREGRIFPACDALKRNLIDEIIGE